MRFVLCAGGLSRKCSIFLRGITMTAVKTTTEPTLVLGNPVFPHEMTREDFLSLKTITLFHKGSTGVKSASSCPQVTGL